LIFESKNCDCLTVSINVPAYNIGDISSSSPLAAHYVVDLPFLAQPFIYVWQVEALTLYEADDAEGHEEEAREVVPTNRVDEDIPIRNHSAPDEK
jgi:hypothetical protein